MIKKCLKKTNKPLEFIQLTEKNRDDVLEWIAGCGRPGLQGGILLNTPENAASGQHVSTGSYIIKGYSAEQGWHYWPVKADYFEENYMVL